MSPKTVDAALARVYRKLGIRFRTGFARRIASPRDEGAQASGPVGRAAKPRVSDLATAGRPVAISGATAADELPPGCRAEVWRWMVASLFCMK